eukprot:gnl/Dysnectes_brevis/7616_a12934_167.p1 GENE.gnl/Dysnectes_brevis/7616_a12934_167~~gnl/Dysnectes_brevis/7616_a12934_167.p1  ORF type:complete len:549 (-),score=198.51 gnl/Dysnectes_brevis/7616_a12934_167:118-1740(-)
MTTHVEDEPVMAEDTSQKNQVKDEIDTQSKALSPWLFRDRVLLIPICLFPALLMFLEFSIIPSFAFITQEDGFSDYSVTTQSWIFSGFSLAQAISSPLVGVAGDKWGKKRCILIMLLIENVSLWLSTYCKTLPQLIVSRVLQGSAGGSYGLCFGIARDLLPADRVGSAVGLVSSAYSVGIASGLLFGGMITSTIGWRGSFAIAAPISLVLLTYFYFLCDDYDMRPPKALRLKAVYQDLPERQHLQEEYWRSRKMNQVPLDVPGALYMTLGILLLLLGLTRLEEHGVGLEEGWTTLALVWSGVSLLVYWWALESTTPHPFLQPTLLAGPLTVVGTAFFFSGVSLLMINTVLPRYLAEPVDAPWHGHGLTDAFRISLIMLPLPFTEVIGAYLVGRLSARWKGDVLMMIMMWALGGAYLVGAVWHRSTLSMLVGQGLLGLPIAGSISASTLAVTQYAKQESFGAALGMITLLQLFGITIGPLLGSLITAPFTEGGHTEERGYVLVFVVGGMLCLLGALLLTLMILGRVAARRRDEKEEAVRGV